MGNGAEKRHCLSPAPFSAHRKSAQIRPKMARTPSLGLGYSLSLKEATQRLTRANTRDFYVGCLWDDTTSRRKRMCAFTACVRFLRRRGPAGLRDLFYFCRNCGLFILHSGLSACTKRGVVSLPSDRFARFGNPARPGIRTAYFAALGSWSAALPKNAERLRNSDAFMRVAVPQASRPRWAA